MSYSDLLHFLDPYKTSIAKVANVLSFTGTPAPGKWYIPDKAYEKFVELVDSVTLHEPLYFVERHPKADSARVILDLDSKVPIQGDYFKAVLTFTDLFFELKEDTNIGLVKEAKDPRKKKFSYHIIFPFIGMQIGSQEIFARNLIKYLEDNEPENPIRQAIDLLLYETDGERGLRMCHCSKSKELAEGRPTKPSCAFAMKDGQFSVVSHDKIANFTMHSSLHWYPTATPQKGLTLVKPPPPPDGVPIAKANPFVTLTESHFGCPVVSAAMTENKYGRAMKLRLRTKKCLIKKGDHSNEDGRCVILNQSEAYYCCLSSTCNKTKKMKIKGVYDPDQLAEAFGDEEPEVAPPASKATPPKRKAAVAKPQRPPKKIKLSPFQHVLEYTYGELEKRRYRRSGTDVVAAHTDSMGRETGFWVTVSSIKEFVMKIASRDTNEEMYFLRTKQSTTTDNVVKELMAANVKAFPTLARSHSVFSFIDWQYDACTRTFESHDVKHAKVSANYIHCEIPDEFINDPVARLNWESPHHDSIFNFQGFTKPQIEVAYVMTGECLHEIGEHSQHQHFMYLRGPPGIGKSCYFNSVGKFWADGDTCTIQADNSKTFGLEGKADKFFISIPDMDKTPGIAQSMFNSMVCGIDPVTVNRKHTKEVNLKEWKVPIMGGGNLGIGFEDTGGSTVRRTIEFYMKTPVVYKNVNLPKLLDSERGPYLIKCNEWFFEYEKRIAAANVEAQASGAPPVDFLHFIDPYFLGNQKEQRIDSNALINFLESGEMDIQPKSETVYMPIKTFCIAFNDFCVNRKFAVQKWGPDLYEDPFKTYGITYVKRAETGTQLRRLYPRDQDPTAKFKSTLRGDFLFGIDVVAK